jgi:transcriptional antiterminator Rof (Rho-off)
MKKISFVVSIASLLAAAPAFAQTDNYLELEQNGANTQVNVDQIGAVGHVNTATIHQGDLTAVNGAVVEVKQEHRSGNSGEANTLSIFQDRNKTNSNVVQISRRSNNTAEIHQLGTGSPSSGENLVELKQRGRRNTNYAFIEQEGQSLEIDADQKGIRNDNRTTILQHGNGSSADLLQNGQDNQLQDARITQNGNRSNVNVTQNGSGNILNDTTITQNGSDSTIVSHQGGNGNSNSSNIIQNGNVSGILINQGGDDNTNTSVIEQYASNSNIELNQGLSSVGLVNDSTIIQTGNNHSVVVNQN